VPLIDQVHRLMHLWREGEIVKVDEYLESRALLRNNAFHQLLQAVIELSDTGSEERSILESISNHLKGSTFFLLSSKMSGKITQLRGIITHYEYPETIIIITS